MQRLSPNLYRAGCRAIGVRKSSSIRSSKFVLISQAGTVDNSGADPGIYLGGGPNQGPQSKTMGEARIEGAKRPRIEGEARTEGEARENAGGGVWGGGSVSPSPENFRKIKLEIIHFGAYLKQLSEITNEMV